MIADTTKAPVRCTTVGVPNAATEPGLKSCRRSAIKVMTTNCRPMRAPADEPTMT